MNATRCAWAVCLALGLQLATAGELAEAQGGGGAPTVEHVRVAPSGDRVVAIVGGEGKCAAAVIELAGGPPTVVLQTDARRQFLDACDWASDQRIVCSVFDFPDRKPSMGTFSHRFRVRLIAVDRDGGKPQRLIDEKLRKAPLLFGYVRPKIRHTREDIEHVVVHHLPSEPDHVLVRAARDAEPYTSVYRADINDGSMERVLEYQHGIVFWHADRQGSVRLGTGWYEVGPRHGKDAAGSAIAGPRRGGAEPARTPAAPSEPWAGPTAVAVATDGAVSRIDVAPLAMPIGESDLAVPRVLGFSRDGAHLYYEAAVGDSARTAVWQADAASLAPQRQLAADPLRDVRATAVAGESCGVVGFMHPLPERPFTWLDANVGADVNAAAQQLGRRVVAVPSMSADCQRLVVVTTDGASRRFHLLDRADGSLRDLGSQHPNFDASGVATRETTYRTRDGNVFPITVAQPVEARQPLPVVVILDGEVRPDSLERQDMWLHHFAARGYAVAKPAVRGQRGYGWENQLAGRRSGGFKLRDDVEDALAWLAQQGLGDRGDACFLGRADGGHLALAAALGGAQSDDGQDAPRCVAAYAPKDIRRARRSDLRPFGQCLDYPCDDWMRWAAPSKALARYLEPRGGLLGKLDEPGTDLGEPATSPLLNALHPGFPVLIWTDDGTVYERGSSRYRTDVGKLAYFTDLAPVGSDNEAAFLEAAEALFARELGTGPGH